MSSYEKAWQITHIVDVVQTSQYQYAPCLVEVDPMTVGLIGENPSTEVTVAWGIASSFASAYISKKINQSDLPEWAKHTIGTLKVGNKAYLVASNQSLLSRC